MIRHLFPTVGDAIAALAWLALIALWRHGARGSTVQPTEQEGAAR